MKINSPLIFVKIKHLNLNGKLMVLINAYKTKLVILTKIIFHLLRNLGKILKSKKDPYPTTNFANQMLNKIIVNQKLQCLNKDRRKSFINKSKSKFINKNKSKFINKNRNKFINKNRKFINKSKINQQYLRQNLV